MGKAWLWAADEGGCGWYRTRIVAEALRGLGHDVGQGVEYDPSYADADAVLGQRVCTPGPTTQWAGWNFAGAKTTVFDADDDYFHLSEHPEFGQSAFEYGQSRIQARLLANAFSSSYTACATARIAELFSVYCNNTVVVPNGLPKRYLDRPGPWERSGFGVDRPVVGWAGSSFTQWELGDRVKSALSRVPDMGGVVHTVGVPYPVMKQLGMAQPGYRITGWVHGSEQYLDTVDFDVWVAPYRDTLYNQAKFPTKALEAAFLGIPIVASNTTPYRDFVIDGVTGYLIGPGDSWTEAVEDLVRHPATRRRMGEAARAEASRYTIEKIAADKWAPLLFGGKK